MKKGRRINVRGINGNFPLLFWASILAAVLVAILIILAFYFINRKQRAEKVQLRPGRLVSVTDVSERPGPDLTLLNQRSLQLAEIGRSGSQATRERLRTTTVILTFLTLIVISFFAGVMFSEVRQRYKAHRLKEELDVLKSRFVSLASHEFRTPLSSVKLSASLIEKYVEKCDQENVLRQTKKIHVAIGYLTVMLEEFLSLEKIENGKVSIAPQLFDLPLLCNEIEEEIRVMMQPQQQLKCIHMGFQSVVWMDKHLLKNAIVNLLTNAVKYAGENAIIKLETDIREKRISIKVIDDGPGIPENCQKDLFTPFYRVNQNTPIPGTGLGLTIVKKYAELMSGSVLFTSVPNFQTVFELSFPVFNPVQAKQYI